MPILVPQKHGGAVKMPMKGESNNPNGRPRKWTSYLKDRGYKLSEINDCIQVLIEMDAAELKGVLINEQATILERTVAGALIKSLKKGDLIAIETLLSRVYGTPKQTINQKNENTFKITLNLDARGADDLLPEAEADQLPEADH